MGDDNQGTAILFGSDCSALDHRESNEDICGGYVDGATVTCDGR